MTDILWAPLRALILSIPPSRLLLIPSLGGSVWFVTLTGLLMTWIARGMPRYPGQRNPDVAFISEIASFELKPFFLIGASITATCFIITIAAVHVMRYEPAFAFSNTDPTCPYDSTANPHPEIDVDNNNDTDIPEENEENYEDNNITKTLKLISLLSILAAIAAGISLILFGVRDTFRHPAQHEMFTRIYFASLSLQAAGTAVVYVNEITGFLSYLLNGCRWRQDWGGRGLRVRVCAFLSTALILFEVFLGVASISLTIPEVEHYLAAGILEWIIAFSGTVYLWLFCGFLDRKNVARRGSRQVVPRSGRQNPRGRISNIYNGKMHQCDPERRPLLGSDAHV